MTRFTIRINNTLTRRPCTLCGQSFTPDDYAVEDTTGPADAYLCHDCVDQHAPDLGPLLHGYALDVNTSDDARTSSMAWLAAFLDLGVLNPGDEGLALELLAEVQR